MRLKFTKMHGCGNDYIYINCFNQEVKNPSKLSSIFSDRRKGIGGDGIILVCHSEKADAKMRMFNKDGSEGKMCGNGIRCVAKFLLDNNLSSKKNLEIETLSGIKELEILENNENVATVKVNMDKAELSPEKIPMINFNQAEVINEPITVGGEIFNITCVSMGNPHCVIFCDDIFSINVKDIGTRLSSSKIFPEGVNVEFVRVLDKNNLQMRVWERGSGETLACGTGACASVVAAVLNGFCKKNQEVIVHLRGGNLKVKYTDEAVFMTGEAVKVFDGELSVFQ